MLLFYLKLLLNMSWKIEIHSEMLLFTKHYQQQFYFFSHQIQESIHSTYNFFLSFTIYTSLKEFLHRFLHLNSPVHKVLFFFSTQSLYILAKNTTILKHTYIFTHIVQVQVISIVEVCYCIPHNKLKDSQVI